MVFYRKYRPQTLDELDTQKVRELLSRYLAQEHPPHAFLFSGPRGIGKTSSARIVAKSLNCTRKKKGACGTCNSCKSIATGDNLDVIEIDAASNRGIDEIRQLKDSLHVAPLAADYKVYIIDEVHMLTTEAFNALLKSLEEPPPHVVFIMATTEPHKVLDTVKSRCVQVPFSYATEPELLAALKRIVAGEQLQAADEALEKIAQAADGSFRDAAKLLEQAALSDKPITAETVSAIVQQTDGQRRHQLLQLLREKKTSEALALIDELSRDNVNIRLLTQNMLEDLHELLLLLYTKQTKTEWKPHALRRLIALLTASWQEFKTAMIPTLPLELAVIDYCENATDHALASFATPANSRRPPISLAETQVASTDGSVAEVVEHWDEILEALKSHNHSIVGVLRSCRPVRLQDNVLILESPYKFHAERLGEATVQKLLARVVSSVVGSEVSVKTELAQSS